MLPGTFTNENLLSWTPWLWHNERNTSSDSTNRSIKSSKKTSQSFSFHFNALSSWWWCWWRGTGIMACQICHRSTGGWYRRAGLTYGSQQFLKTCMNCVSVRTDRQWWSLILALAWVTMEQRSTEDTKQASPLHRYKVTHSQHLYDTVKNSALTQICLSSLKGESSKLVCFYSVVHPIKSILSVKRRVCVDLRESGE